MAVISFLRILSFLVALIGIAFVFPIGVAIRYKEFATLSAFIIPLGISWIIALLFLFFGRKQKLILSNRASFVIVAGCWIAASLFGAIPLYVSGAIPVFTDAVFESVSGITTTGATILSDVESLPVCMNVWRCEMNWLGGMGIVALTVALLPLLGVGGFQLIKAETTGPEKGKITPKIATTAKTLWFIYCVFTALQIILLMAFGMNFIDAVCHAFSCLGTGGFSNKNASLGAYDSRALHNICTLFMIIAGINFSLYFHLIRGKFDEIKNNSEFRGYLAVLFTAVMLVAVWITPQMHSFKTALHHAFFTVASIMSTTGLSTQNYETWTPLAQFVLFVLFFIGGSSGSTSGGIKVIRWIIIKKQIHNETERMLHPHGIFSIRVNCQPGRKDIVYSVAAFIGLYFFVGILTGIVGAVAGLDMLTSFSAAFSMLGNVGPAFGTLGPAANYGGLPSIVKWWYSFTMISGRLELYTMLIFFTPAFWRR